MDIFRVISWLFWQVIIISMAITGLGLALYSAYLTISLFIGFFK